MNLQNSLVFSQNGTVLECFTDAECATSSTLLPPVCRVLLSGNKTCVCSTYTGLDGRECNEVTAGFIFGEVINFALISFCAFCLRRNWHSRKRLTRTSLRLLFTSSSIGIVFIILWHTFRVFGPLIGAFWKNGKYSYQVLELVKDAGVIPCSQISLSISLAILTRTWMKIVEKAPGILPAVSLYYRNLHVLYVVTVIITFASIAIGLAYQRDAVVVVIAILNYMFLWLATKDIGQKLQKTLEALSGKKTKMSVSAECLLKDHKVAVARVVSVTATRIGNRMVSYITALLLLLLGIALSPLFPYAFHLDLISPALMNSVKLMVYQEITWYALELNGHALHYQALRKARILPTQTKANSPSHGIPKDLSERTQVHWSRSSIPRRVLPTQTIANSPFSQKLLNV